MNKEKSFQYENSSVMNSDNYAKDKIYYDKFNMMQDKREQLKSL